MEKMANVDMGVTVKHAKQTLLIRDLILLILSEFPFIILLWSLDGVSLC